MAEAQKICDREMCGIRSIACTHNCYLNHKTKDRIQKIKYVNDIIQDLECHGPAGLIHIAILSSIIDRPIRIWNADGSLNNIIGRRKTGYPIDIEYHAINSEGVGHWTLRSGKDPDNIIIDLNSCLFSVIGSQIGQDPLRLRKWTVLKLKNNFYNLAEWIDKIFQLKKNDGVILMIGGAKYNGTSPEDAKKIMDMSEGKCAHNFRCLQAHPRGHASSEEKNIQRIETYSFGKYNFKTGFLSRDDQNFVIHHALLTKDAQDAMVALNCGSFVEKVIISAENLGPNLPKIAGWKNGELIGTNKDICMVILILRHQLDKFCESDADVFIQTCYPTLDKEVRRQLEGDPI